MKIFVLFILVLSVPTLALAKNIWRDCGIGALLFSDTGWAAVTSNITWDLGTTASSSTSSSEDQCAGNLASAANFIHQNYAIIEEETAAGSGDHLVTMLNIIGCEKSTHDNVINSLREEFKRALAQPEYSAKTKIHKAEAYYNNVVENAVSQKCAIM